MNGYTISETPVTFGLLEKLYRAYRCSAPGQAPPEAVVAGANRQRAREKLEMAVLEGSLNGTLSWPEDGGWFWRSETEPDLVVVKRWVAPNG